MFIENSTYRSGVRVGCGWATAQGRRTKRGAGNLFLCPPLLERIAFRLPSGTRSRRLFELSHLNRNYLQFSSVPRMLRLGNEVCSEVDFFCNRLGALRRAVLTVRLETFESE
ncbi:hypothetical protein J6590_050304 [Homalodisca vitripennis]|nr:hypothetical protein J6590_050304 [Homalodisca vitripennis]